MNTSARRPRIVWPRCLLCRTPLAQADAGGAPTAARCPGCGGGVG